MSIPVRLALMLGCLVVMVGAGLSALGLHPLRSLGLGADLSAVEVVRLTRPESATAARLKQDARTDLTGYGTPGRYVPDPLQGTRHVTESGVVWWAAGPVEGPPRPVVILLHGAGRDGHSMVDMWHEVAMAEGVILVAPDFGSLPDSSVGLYDPRAALAALDQAATLYPVDDARVVLFGHSRGGIAAQLWANRVDGPWRAVAVHAGTLPANLVAPVTSGKPVRHYLGTMDQTFSFEEGRESAAAMADAGHPFELVALSGHTHWFYEQGEAISADAWNWLRGQLG
ncbi:MAG: dienelactone hydrolase family protein [Jannaschia sp.]